MDNNFDFNNKSDSQDKPGKAFLKGMGIFFLSLFLAVVTVLIISI